jgi:hypothetical protein
MSRSRSRSKSDQPAGTGRSSPLGLVVSAEPTELLSGVAILRSISSIRGRPGARSRVMSGLTGGHATNRDWRPLIRLPQNASALAYSQHSGRPAGTAKMTLAYAAERHLRLNVRGPLDYDDGAVPVKIVANIMHLLYVTGREESDLGLLLRWSYGSMFGLWHGLLRRRIPGRGSRRPSQGRLWPRR